MPIKPILITGSHRSGSTWAGKMLAAAPHTAYIHEPFNIGINISLTRSVFKHWFEYICKDNSVLYENEIGRLIHYKYPLISNFAKAKTAREVAKTVRDQGFFLWYKLNNYTPIIKDPIAIFSAEWLSQVFNMNVLVMVRHPAAFCSSLKIKDWYFDFNHFLDQPLLMKAYLRNFEEDIKEYAKTQKNIIDQAILLWNCIHYTISVYQKKHTDWLFVKHEDLSLDPVNQFRLLYEKLGLEFTRESELTILKSSGAQNPIEQQEKNEFIRNSKQNIHNWKKRLSQSEVDQIKDRTSELSSIFYTEDDW